MLSKTDIDLNLRHPLSLACGSSLLSSLSIVCNAPQPVHQPPGSTSAVEVESPRAGSRDSSCSVSHTRSAAATPGWLHCTRCAWRRVLCVLGRRQMSAHSATALGRCATSRVAAELRRFRTSVQRSFDSSVALQHFHCSLHPARPNTTFPQRGLNTRTGTWHCRKSPALQRRSRDLAAAIYALGALQTSRLHCNDATHLKPG